MRGHIGTLLRLLGLAAVIALLTACAETTRRPGYPDSSNPPPVPKIFVGEFSGYPVKGLPAHARQLLTDALREHLRERDLLWTDSANPRIDLTGMMEAYEGRYGDPPDDKSVVIDLKGELRDNGKLLGSAIVNRHVEIDADWKDEMDELAESLVDELMRRVAPPPETGRAGYPYGYPADPYYYPGSYYGYDVGPYGYYYGGLSYWWPQYYWGWGGRHFHHHDHGRPGGGGGGAPRPSPRVPPAVFDAVPRTYPRPGMAPPAFPRGDGPRAPSEPIERPRFRNDSSPLVPPAVFDAPRSQRPFQSAPAPVMRPPSLSPSVDSPRFRPMEPRPSFSAPQPAMRVPSFSPPSFSAPSINRAPAMPSPPPMRSVPSAPPAGMFRAPSVGGGGEGGRRRGR